jgi:hypothetical protein
MYKVFHPDTNSIIPILNSLEDSLEDFTKLFYAFVLAFYHNNPYANLCMTIV